MSRPEDASAAAGGYAAEPLGRFAELLDGPDLPAGGAAAAATTALAAGLTGMVARAAAGRLPDAGERASRAGELRARALALVDEDVAAYGRVLAARRDGAGGDDPGGEDGRGDGVSDGALADATDVPLATAETAAGVVELASHLHAAGHPTLRPDAAAAVRLAAAAARTCLGLAAANLEAAGHDEGRRDRAAAVEARLTRSSA